MVITLSAEHAGKNSLQKEATSFSNVHFEHFQHLFKNHDNIHKHYNIGDYNRDMKFSYCFINTHVALKYCKLYF